MMPESALGRDPPADESNTVRKMAKKPAAKKRSATKLQYNDILYEVKDQVAWATINRPRVLNAFREQTLDELIDALKSTPRGSLHRLRGRDRRRRQVVFRRRRLLRHEAAQLRQRRHVERPHAGSGHDHTRPADSGHRHGQRLVHGRRPRARPVVRPGHRLRERGAGPDWRTRRRLPDRGRDAVPAAHHRRAARARDDLLRAALQREGSGGDRPHQQVRAAERSPQRDA